MKTLPRLLLPVLLAVAPLMAQEFNPFSGPPPSGPPPVSPEFKPDRMIVFRLRAPDAKSVSLALSASKQHVVGTRDDKGVWTMTAGPLKPEVYSYMFVVDGVPMPDPFNPDIGSGQTLGQSILDVPGEPAALDQVQAVPHGTIHIHTYDSKVLKRTKPLWVYTPPGYDSSNAAYPVFVLRHGAGGSAQSMAVEGRAPEILDNLIAQGRAKPMIIVMPDGYAEKPVGAGSYEQRNSAASIAALGDETIQDILPFVEAHYRTLPGPENRAITGFSMGAGQSFLIGLRNLDTFAWVGEMSSGVISLPDFELTKQVPGFLEHPDADNRKLKLLWLSCGSEDPRREGQHKMTALLKSKGINFRYREAPGGHELSVERQDIADFAQLLFK